MCPRVNLHCARRFGGKHRGNLNHKGHEHISKASVERGHLPLPGSGFDFRTALRIANASRPTDHCRGLTVCRRLACAQYKASCSRAPDSADLSELKLRSHAFSHLRFYEYHQTVHDTALNTTCTVQRPSVRRKLAAEPNIRCLERQRNISLQYRSFGHCWPAACRPVMDRHSAPSKTVQCSDQP